MQYIGVNEVREKFLSFFESKEHLRLHSFSLVPQIDKSLLLINSGMAPLKPYFTGQETPPSKRIVTCQKCIRTPDIDNTGKTARHGTFFEMLGNFSFGDYFKKEAIQWSWEFMRKVMEIPFELLYVSIYEEDEEAYDIWHNTVGLPEEKIVRLGKEDNFWEIGTGPCGPCSEIYVDRGEAYGCDNPNCAVGCECDRYIEVWNLVFTQFNRDEEGNYTPLDFPNIDTGMGLERMAMVMQGAESIFAVDTIKNVLDYVCTISEKTYGEDEKTDVSIRVITDHVRSVVFMVADGILPQNEGRGYVLRRLLRRAARHGRLLGIDHLFLGMAAEKVINQSMEAYPELNEKRAYILRIIKAEEEKFSETIQQGLGMMHEIIDFMKEKKQTVFDGEIAFRLYDTYGFPLELTEEILAENHMRLEIASYNKAMDEQKQRAREAHRSKDIAGWIDETAQLLVPLRPTKFLGYDVMTSSATVQMLLTQTGTAEQLDEGQSGIAVLNQTPFYSESGGQVGDSGLIQSKKATVRVKDTQKSGDKVLHYITVTKGVFSTGDKVEAKVDRRRRMDIMRNHSATHLLHQTLRNILGEHVSQAGSLVEPAKLRFDFTHFEKIDKEELKQIEKQVNEQIYDALQVHKEEMTIDEAKEKGAIALFGEKYADRVRVVSMGEYSMELCGGCHIDNTGQIGLFKILSEGSVASGVRRIEASTGRHAYQNMEDALYTLEEVQMLSKADQATVADKVRDAFAEIKSLNRRLEEYKAASATDAASTIAKSAKDIGDIRFFSAVLTDSSVEELRTLSDRLKDSCEKCVVALIGEKDGKHALILTASKAVGTAFHSGKVIKEAAALAGGSGGGRPDMAQAGIASAENAEEIFAFIAEKIAQ